MKTFRHAGAFACLAISAATLWGCGSGQTSATDSEAAVTPGSSASVKEVTVPPGVSSPIWFDAPANAKCEVTAGDKSFTLYADDEGRAIVWMTPPSVSGAPAEIVADCDGSVQTLSLQVVEGAAKPVLPARSKPPAKTLPALTPDAAASYTNSELREMGYPPRPSAETYPEAYAKWLEGVSKPWEVREPVKVPRRHRAGKAHTAGTAGNSWSGSVLFANPSRPANYVYGWWNVPSVAVKDMGSDALQWVGVDGYNLGDLWQTGSETQVIGAFLGYGYYIFSSYDVWTETLPTQGSMDYNYPGSSVSPGDLVAFAVYITPMWLSYSVKYTYWNYTTNTTISVPESFSASGNPLYGQTVEWIVENPALSSGGGTDLAQFTTTSMGGWGGFDNGSIEDWYVPGGNCVEAGACEPAYPHLGSTQPYGTNPNTGDLLDYATLNPAGTFVNVFWNHFN